MLYKTSVLPSTRRNSWPRFAGWLTPQFTIPLVRKTQAWDCANHIISDCIFQWAQLCCRKIWHSARHAGGAWNPIWTILIIHNGLQGNSYATWDPNSTHAVRRTDAIKRTRSTVIIRSGPTSTAIAVAKWVGPIILTFSVKKKKPPKGPWMLLIVSDKKSEEIADGSRQLLLLLPLARSPSI